MNFLLCLLLSTTLAAFALWKKSMTPGGTLLAWLLCLWISYKGGKRRLPFAVFLQNRLHMLR